MCTSFSIYSNETLYGMNFDISSRPIKFSITNRNGNKALFISQKDHENFYPAFGFTENGVFANLLMVNENEDGRYRRGKNVVHIMKIFDEVLSNQLRVEEIEEKYLNQSIVNVPMISVHSMITNMNTTVFVEPGKTILTENNTLNKFFVLSNCSIFDCKKNEENRLLEKNDDRYNTCYLGLERHKENISVEKGFEILDSCSQKDGDFPTQLSIISKPREKEIYFTIERNFEKIYKYSFETNQINVWKGEKRKGDIPIKKEILLTELTSNEI